MSESEIDGNEKSHSQDIEIKALKAANHALTQVFDSKWSEVNRLNDSIKVLKTNAESDENKIKRQSEHIIDLENKIREVELD